MTRSATSQATCCCNRSARGCEATCARPIRSPAWVVTSSRCCCRRPTGEQARLIAERLLRAFVAPFPIASAQVEVGSSIGIALYPDHGTDADTLLRHADMAMYMAKSDRSGWALYTPERDHYSPDRLALVADLRHAIDSDRARAALPTTGRRTHGRVRRRRSAHALATSRAWAAGSRQIHSAGRTNPVDPAAHALGNRDRAAAIRSLASGGPGCAGRGESVGARRPGSGLPQVVAELLSVTGAPPEHSGWKSPKAACSPTQNGRAKTWRPCARWGCGSPSTISELATRRSITCSACRLMS